MALAGIFCKLRPAAGSEDSCQTIDITWRLLTIPKPSPAWRFSPTRFIRRDDSERSSTASASADKRYSLAGENMIPRSCVAIETKKFPVLEGEGEEIVNENMYGKALCNYLEHKLPKAGIRVPSFCAEDWGWWLEVQDNDFTMGLCIYSDPAATQDPEKYAILASITKGQKWSWSKFRTVDVSAQVLKVMDAVEIIFRNDNEITSVTRHDDFPF